MNRDAALLRERRRVALDQVADARRQGRVVDHVERAAAAVLAAPAFLPGQRALLVHVAENDVALLSGRRDADLGVVVVGPLPAGQAERRAGPLAGGGDLDRAGRPETRIPAADAGRG